MEKNRESAEDIVHSFTDLLNKLIPVSLALKGLHALTGGILSHYTFAAKSLVASSREIYMQRRESAEHLRDLRAKLATGEVSLSQYRDARFVHAATRDVFKAQVRLSRELDEAGRIHVGLVAAGLALAVKTLDTSIRYNEALLEANAGFFRRFELMQSMARVQAQTGTAQATLVNATRSLVRFGLESKDSFEANLKTVVMLHDAVGLTTDESAHLAAVTENYARASFQRTADVVATLVEQTALAASEVKNLGIELQRALGVVSPGPTNLPQVVQALGGYEAALKEVSGRVGGFQKLVTNLATPEGMLQAGMLGVTPDMIRTKEGIDRIMDRFGNLVDRVVGNSEGLNRVWRLDTVAKMMNLSREEVNEMSLALQRHRTQAIQETTLQDLYTEQVRNLNQGVSRLVTGLSAVLQMGLYPFVAVLSYVINGVASIIQKLTEFKELGVVAFALVAAGGFYLALQLRKVWTAFLQVAAAVQIATQRLREHAAAQLAARIPGAGGASAGAAGAGRIGGLFGIGVANLAALTVIAAGIAWIGYLTYRLLKVSKDTWDEQHRVIQEFTSRSQALEVIARQRMYFRERSGDTEGAMKLFSQMLLNKAADLRQQHVPLPQIEAELDRMRAQSEEDLTRARFTKTAFGSPYIDKMQFDAEKWTKLDHEMKVQTLEILKKTQDTAKKGVEQDRLTDDHLQEAYDIWWMKSYRYFFDNPIGVGIRAGAIIGGGL